MQNYYIELYFHAVFAVKNKNALLDKSIRNKVFEYIAGILRKEKCTVLAVNGYDDHVHIFFSCGPDMLFPKLMQIVKGRSSAWINASKLCEARFAWQSGYILVSRSKSDSKEFVEHLIDQEDYHKKVSFYDEFIELLKDEGIEYDERYVFQPPS